MLLTLIPRFQGGVESIISGFLLCWVFSGEVVGYVNKCAFSEQDELDLSHRIEL